MTIVFCVFAFLLIDCQTPITNILNVGKYKCTTQKHLVDFPGGSFVHIRVAPCNCKQRRNSTKLLKPIFHICQWVLTFAETCLFFTSLQIYEPYIQFCREFNFFLSLKKVICISFLLALFCQKIQKWLRFGIWSEC